MEPIQNINKSSKLQEEQPNKQQPSQLLIKDKQSDLRSQLLDMEFEQSLIDKALLLTDNLEKGIQIIVSILEQQDEQSIAQQDTLVMILLVRVDLKMTLGKIAAQCGHATLKAFQLGRQRAQYDDTYALSFIQWLETGRQMMYFKVQSEEQLYDLLSKTKANGHNTCYIRDAGRTQVAAGSTTVGAVGPCSLKTVFGFINKLKKL